MRKKLFFIGTLAYLIMTIMAVILFKERIAFLDGSFILFSILSEGDLAVQVYRFGSAITQAVPLIASWMDFSLESIMKIYSACFPVYFYGLFLICLLVLKKEWYAILLLLFNVGMVTHTFYWVIPEFQQGLSLMVVYFALLEKAMERGWFKKIWYQLLNLVLVCTLAFFHPLMIFPFAFFITYILFFSDRSKGYSSGKSIRKLLQPSSSNLENEIIEQPKQHFDLRPLFVSVLAFLVFFLLKTFVFKTAYDSGAMKGLNNFVRFFPDYWSVKSNKQFWGFLVTDYYLLILALATISVYFVRNKKKIQLGFTFFSFFGYLLLINISYPDGPHQFYIESLYLPLSLILFFPLVFDILRKLDTKILLIALTVVVGIRLVHIYQTHPLYTQRIDYIRDFLDATEKLPNKKLVLSSKQVNEKKLLLSWGFPYECWLISTIETGQTRSLVTKKDNFINTKVKMKYVLNDNKAFAARWGMYPYEYLPKRYFVFRDTSFYIVPVETEQ